MDGRNSDDGSDNESVTDRTAEQETMYNIRENSRRILTFLDRNQQSKLPEHLLSSHTLRKECGYPKPYWGYWPDASAPEPIVIDDSDIDDSVRVVSEDQLKRQKQDAIDGHVKWTFTSPDDSDLDRQRHNQLDAARILLDACEARLQKEVYDRIAKEPGLEPVIDPAPRLGPLAPIILERLERYMRPISSKPPMSQQLDWSKLDIDEGPVIQRLENLFGPRESYQVQVRKPMTKQKSSTQEGSVEPEDALNAPEDGHQVPPVEQAEAGAGV